MLPAGNDSLLVYGGFSRVREGRAERTQTHTDAFRLAGKGDGWTWRAQSGGALAPPARAGQAAAANPHTNRGYVFGGVSDVEETEEELKGEMSDELLLMDLETGKWHNVTLKSEQQSAAPITQEVQEETTTETVTVVTDEVFTMKLGGAPAPRAPPASSPAAAARPRAAPSARMSAMLAVQRSVLYLYGGVLERDDKQFYLGDMYSLDLHKLSEWQTIVQQPSLPDWLGSDSDDSATESDSGSDDSSESDEE